MSRPAAPPPVAMSRPAVSARVAAQQAATLIDALPWLQRFSGKVVVIKYGGNAMTAPQLQSGFAQDVVFLRYAGVRPVVVHGVDPQITEQLHASAYH